MNTVELLKKLTANVGVSGDEKYEIKNVLCDILAQYGEVTVDVLNNIYCTFGDGYHFLLDAHYDEIGMIVTSITDDGFIKVTKCGGIDERMLLGYEVEIHGSKKVRGIISNLPPHLTKADDNKVPKIEDVSIDIGLTRVEAEKIISPGDRVTFKRHFDELLNNQVSSNALDNRSGVAAIILAIENLKNVDAKITVVFSSQEEVGTRGAKIAAYSRNVDEAIVVDVSFGYTPLCKNEDCGEIGKGAMIGFSPILDSSISKDLIAVAKEKSILHQIEVIGDGRTGTNADVISISGSGIKTSLISIPEKYMHSPVEIVDIGDVECVASLIDAYIKHRVGDKNA